MPHQTLGAIRNLLQKGDILPKAIVAALPHDQKWLLGELPAQLESRP